MKAHIVKTRTELEQTINKQLTQVYRKGLTVGSKSISKVLYDIASDKNKTADERLEEIIKFCETALKSREGKNEKGHKKRKKNTFNK